jgi:hypothetical protein
MPRYLQVNYAQPQYWALPLRTALTAKPSLQQRDQKWQTSVLSDLAFSITTRIGAIEELVRLTDEALDVLGAELHQASNLEELVAGGYAYSFSDDSAVRRSLVLLTMFAAEGESLFENLAEFYRRFLDHYFGDKIDLKTSEGRVIAFSNSPAWRGELSLLRNTTRHRFAPWLAFEDMGQQADPRWEPILTHDWRPERLSQNTSTALGHLRDIKTGLAQAAQGVLRDLVNRVSAAP